MTLGEYLAEKEMTTTAFARLVGVDQTTISRLIPRHGKKSVRRPSWHLVERIAAATGGLVTANDFMDLGAPREGEGEGGPRAGGPAPQAAE